MVMDIAPLMQWLGVFMAFLAFGTSVWSIFSAPSRKLAERQDATDKKVADQLVALSHAVAVNEAGLTRLRDRVDSMPNADMMHRLELSFARMEGHIDRLDERMKPVAAIAERMQDLLIEQGHRK